MRWYLFKGKATSKRDRGLHDKGIVSGYTPLPGSKSAVNADLTKFILYQQYNLITMAVV